MSELGQVLRKAREEKGLTLEDIEEMTKIQRRYLEAIEKGNFDVLPGYFYARAFIKSYAEAVGLNPEQLFADHRDSIPSPPALEEPAPLRRKRRGADAPVITGKWLSTTLLVSFIFLIGFLIYMAIVNMNSNQALQSETAPPEQQPSPISGNPEIPGADKPPVNGTEQGENPDAKPEEPSPTPVIEMVKREGNVFYFTLRHAQNFALSIHAGQGRSWMSVKKGENGPEIEQLILEQGMKKDWQVTDAKELWLNIGYLPALEITLNGQKLDISDESLTHVKFSIQLEQGA
ncbi:helix-turn-helix domain-containing protein [Bacillaceae bacterium]